MAGYVERRPARPRPPPESGVRAVALEEAPAAKRGWTNLQAEIAVEFHQYGRVWTRDAMKDCRGERRVFR